MTASRQCKTTPRAPASTHARTNDRNGAASAASISSWDAPSGTTSSAVSATPTRHLTEIGTPRGSATRWMAAMTAAAREGSRMSDAPKSPPPVSTAGHPQLRLISE